MRPIRAGVALAAAFLLCAPPAFARATRWHLDVDVTYLRGALRYFTVPVPTEQCLLGDCSMPSLAPLHLARPTVGLGYGVLTIEAGVAFPVKVKAPYLAWSAGFRLETSTEAPIAIVLRAAYQRTRIEGGAGHGGRIALEFLLRFHPGFQVYAEGAFEVSSVPASLHAYGTYFSYASMVGLGLRMSLR
jgi:hypothetical protein